MGKIIRRVVAVLLAVTGILLAVIPAGYVEATTTHGDYEYDGSTLVKYLGSDKDLTIPNWITKVGKDAFAGNTSLRKIILPDSVKTIDYQAFEGCTNLQEAVVPESVRTIGPSAFSGCTSLYSVNIPEKCESIGSGAFAGCSSLAEISVDPQNLYFTCLDGVLYSKDGTKLVSYLAGRPFTSYTMPNTVKEIEEYAFWGASNLNKISISPNVDAIPEYAFTYCNGLNNVTLPSSVERINAYSFADCNNLEYINIPESVGYIDDKAFYMTNGTILYFVNSVGDIVNKANSSDVDSYASATSEGDLDNNSSSENFDSTGTEDEVSDESSENALQQKTLQNNAPQFTPEANNNDTFLVYPDENYSDGYYTPSRSGGDDWNTRIENRDFADNLDSDNGDIGSSMIVGGNAFVMMPTDVAVKGFDIEDAEREDSSLNSYPSTKGKNNTDYESIGKTYASYNGTDEEVTIPSNVDRIGVRAFYNNINLKNVKLPSGLDYIDDFAFSRSNLESISIPEGTNTIDYAAFYCCPNLNEVYIPQSVEKIALGAFDNTPFMNNFKKGQTDSDFLIVGDGILLAYKGTQKNIVIPENVKHIAAGAFSGNTRITGVVIPPSVNDIGEEAFCGCKNLSQVTFNEGIKDIEDRAFKGTALSCVYFPDSVENIGLGAFDTTQTGQTLKSVIFKGNDVPNISYNDTATRLSAKDLRTKSFEGVPSAIVSQKCNVQSGNLFNPKYYGFEGQIYTYENQSFDEASNQSEGQNATAEDVNADLNNKRLILEYSTTSPDISGNVIINPHVDIAGDSYIMDNVKDYAFDYYKNWSNYYDNKPSNVLIDGNRSEELEKLLENSGLKEENDKEKTTDNNELAAIVSEDAIPESSGNVTQLSNVRCELNSSIFPAGSTAVASVSDTDEKLNLTITDFVNDTTDISSAFEKEYGFKPEMGVAFLDFNLTDKSGTLPIHKLGNKKMEVELPLTDNAAGNDKSLTVATIDENGLLEELPTDVKEDESGNKKIRFVTGHCSTFLIYFKSVLIKEPSFSEETIESENAASTFTVYGVMNNLYKKTPVGISAKWFVIIILFASSGILLLYKKPGKSTKSRKNNERRG